MTAEIIPLGNVTKLDLPPDRILEEAKGRMGEGVVILGWDIEGDFVFASSFADGGTVMWLLETAKKNLLEVVD